MSEYTELPIQERRKLYDRAMELREEKGWGNRKIGQELGVNSSTVNNWIHGRSEPTIRGRKPDLNPSQELSYVIGVVKGDGSVYTDGTQYRVQLNATSEAFVEEFSQCLALVSRRDNVPVYRLESKGQYYTVLCNKILRFFLDRKVEEFESLKKYPCQFLRGFYDSEGGVYLYERGDGWVHVVNTNLELVKYVRKLLQEHLDFSKHSISKQEKGRDKPLYNLRFYSHREIEKFKENVGFSIPEKQKKLRKLVMGKVRGNGTWTKSEISILKQEYPKSGNNIENLDRTLGAIDRKARRLALPSDKNGRDGK